MSVRNEKAILWLRALLNTFLTLQIINGICIFAAGQLLRVNLCKYLHGSERRTIHSHIFYLNVLGPQLFVSDCIGVALARRYAAAAEHARTVYYIVLCLWCFSNFMTIVYGTVMTGVLRYAASSIVELAEIQFLTGISLYPTNHEWHLLIDGLQYEKQCCGANSFVDWYENNRLGNDAYKISTLDLTKLPFSCHKRFNRDILIYDNDYEAVDGSLLASNVSYDSSDQLSIEFMDPNMNINFASGLQINTEGCLPLLSSTFHNLLNIIFLLLGCGFLIQCMVALFIKWLQRRWKRDDDSMENRPIVQIHYPRGRVNCIAIPVDEHSFEHQNFACCPVARNTSENYDLKYFKNLLHHKAVMERANKRCCYRMQNTQQYIFD